MNNTDNIDQKKKCIIEQVEAIKKVKGLKNVDDFNETEYRLLGEYIAKNCAEPATPQKEGGKSKKTKKSKKSKKTKKSKKSKKNTRRRK